MLSLVTLLLKTVWLLLPAYTPNNFAVVFGGGKPIDFGKSFVDGRRILGDGKTFRGFLAGVSGGILVANAEYLIEKLLGFHVFSLLPYPDFLRLSFALAFGSLLGDCAGSFIKRRFGVERGDKFPLLDQYDFLSVSLLISFAIAKNAFLKLFTLPVIATGIVITPVLHRLTNVIAYKLGLKDVPW